MRLFLLQFSTTSAENCVFYAAKITKSPLPDKLLVKIRLDYSTYPNITVASVGFAALFVTLKRTKLLSVTGYWTFVRCIQLLCC